MGGGEGGGVCAMGYDEERKRLGVGTKSKVVLYDFLKSGECIFFVHFILYKYIFIFFHNIHLPFSQKTLKKSHFLPLKPQEK